MCDKLKEQRKDAALAFLKIQSVWETQIKSIIQSDTYNNRYTNGATRASRKGSAKQRRWRQAAQAEDTA